MALRPLSAVVLAAGAGTRMKSLLPKPLHEICERPMAAHVLHALRSLEIDWTVLVIGYGADLVVQALRDETVSGKRIHFVEQHVQRGTGDAVSIALGSLPAALGDDADDADLIVVPGDMPLLSGESIAALLNVHRERDAAATILTVSPEDPTGYGRIVRDKNNRVICIVEERDTTEEQRAIHEVNTSVYCFRTHLLAAALRRIDDNNAQGELLLTDVIAVLAKAGHKIETVIEPGSDWAVGVNDRKQLGAAEQELRKRFNDEWMRAGVTIPDSSSVQIGYGVQLDADVTLLSNVKLSGTTVIRSGAVIGPDVELHNCVVDHDAKVVRSVGDGAQIGLFANVGPYVVLEPGAIVPERSSSGSFQTIGPPPHEGANA